ncbi:MAG: restriction endonuclease subunit S [Pseudanabaena sp. M090S1SP1A06QC]|jgi:type I restriction enzyme S subunit|nr:restriction endonuclease subunit S [Pseudanabaena sp. M007S1SP1A06QC]MCA6614138.1 restriction endonuclease subunit S [Pseudanabaena sp. M090S1SP1A06QC]MCA6621013.1 restriction endonuclease subunit S [Pseudanabaena sp. M165S2SP1A06QC]
MSDDLPMGWDKVLLGDLAEYLNGAAFKPTDWVNEGMPIIRIQNLTDPTKPMNLTTRIVPENLLVKDGDILVSWSATLDAFIWDRGDAWLNQHIFRVLPHEKIVEKYFLFFLLKREIANLIGTEHLHGSTMKHINRGPFLSHEVALPPLNEQRRIVDKLDRIGDRQRSARNELNHIPKLIARYKQSVLAAACSGKLTEDWRIKQNLENSWQSTTLSEVIIDKPKNGYSAKPVQYETPFRVLTLTATTSGKFNSEHFKYFDEYIAEDSQFWVQPNDILIQRGNTIEYVGVPAIYDGLPNQFVFPDLMIRLRAKENVVTKFLYLVLSCENSRQYLRDRATGTAGSMPKINQLRSCTILKRGCKKTRDVKKRA